MKMMIMIRTRKIKLIIVNYHPPIAEVRGLTSQPFRIRVHWGRPRYETKEEDSPPSPPPARPFLTMIKIQGLLRSPLIGSCSCNDRMKIKLSRSVPSIAEFFSVLLTLPMERRVFSPTIPCSNQFFTWNMADRCKMWLKWLVCIFLYFLEVFGEQILYFRRG